MDYIPILIVLGGVLLLLGVLFIMNITCRRERRKLKNLGELRGRTLDEIIKELGNPDSCMPLAHGAFYQWVQFGYHLSLTFNEDGVCVLVDSLKMD